MNKRLRTLAIATLFMAASTPALAALVTLNGNGFDLTYDDATTGLFGAPSLSGDGRTIIFSPSLFVAESLDSQGTRTTNSTVHMTLRPDAGLSIGLLELTERGDYELIRSGEGNNPGPSVSATGQLRALNLSSGGAEITDNLTITSGPFTTVGSNVDWEGEASLDPSLFPQQFGPGALLRLTLENRLTARSFNLGDSAFIEKKTGLVGIDVNVIPLPGALALMLSALGVLLGLRTSRS